MTTDTKQNLIDRLFKAGAHFGFSKSRRHPTVTPYVFANKQGNDLFDLDKTADLIENAKQVLHQAGVQGKTVLYVGTKDEVSGLVEKSALEAQMPYVTNRWIGGMLTNFSEIKKRIERLKDLLSAKESGELEKKHTKKERVVIGRSIDKLQFNFGGIAKLERMPQLLLVVDPRHDSIAVAEAKDMKIPIVAIMSSDCDVSQVNTPVIVNDALTTSVKLALDELTTAYLEGRKSYTPVPPQRPVRTERKHATQGAR